MNSFFFAEQSLIKYLEYLIFSILYKSYEIFLILLINYIFNISLINYFTIKYYVYIYKKKYNNKHMTVDINI